MPRTEPSLFLDDPEVDLVVSLNLLSQLPCLPERYLLRAGAHPPEEVLAYCRDLVQAHLEYLRRLPGVVALITDVESLTVTLAGQSGNFQLNVMLPVIAHNLLTSIALLTNAARALASQAIAGFTVNAARVAEALERNPILVTALNERIGYEKVAQIAKQAYAEGRPIREVAARGTGIPESELKTLLDPRKLTHGGSGGGGG